MMDNDQFPNCLGLEHLQQALIEPCPNCCIIPIMMHEAFRVQSGIIVPLMLCNCIRKCGEKQSWMQSCFVRKKCTLLCCEGFFNFRKEDSSGGKR